MRQHISCGSEWLGGAHRGSLGPSPALGRGLSHRVVLASNLNCQCTPKENEPSSRFSCHTTLCCCVTPIQLCKNLPCFDVCLDFVVVQAAVRTSCKISKQGAPAPAGHLNLIRTYPRSILPATLLLAFGFQAHLYPSIHNVKHYR